MAYSNNYEITTMSPTHYSNEIGIYASKGGDVAYGALTVDFELPYPYILLHIGNGGDIVFQDFEGNNWARYGVLDGSIIAVCAKKILVSGVVNGVSRSTTCEQINWEIAGNLKVKNNVI
jgi:hypothetical protein